MTLMRKGKKTVINCCRKKIQADFEKSCSLKQSLKILVPSAQGTAARGADNNIEHIILFFSLFFPSCRRLLTQLEAAKGSRSSATGDSKPPASAKGPDGVVLYELHSRPEQEKFNESAKVKRKGRWMNVSDGCTSKCFSSMIS